LTVGQNSHCASDSIRSADYRIFKPPTTVSSSRRRQSAGIPNPQGRQVARNPPAHPLIESNPPACAGGSIWSLGRIRAAHANLFDPPTIVSSSTKILCFRAVDYRIFEPPTPVGGYANPQGRQIARNPPAHPLIQSNPPACAGGSIWSLVRIGYSLVSLFKLPTTVVWKHQLSYFQAGDYRIFEPPTPVGGYPNPQGRQVNPL